jgi:glycine hydroxymethyltransferase
MTTRGFNEADARVLANLVADVLANPEDEANLAKVREQVTALCNKYPVYGA